MDYFSEADFAFKGEAEIGLPLLIDELPRPKPIKMRNIPGLIYRDNGEVIANAPIFVEDLDDLGLPSWDLIDPRQYKLRYPLSAPMIATRGCPYRCTFCSAYKINGKQIRTRSVEYLWDEIWREKV